MGYVPLNNYKYDSGYRRIQTGPDNQGFIVLTSGQSAYGANEGIVVAGSPLSGTIAAGAWDYDSNWRYVPGVLPDQSGSIDPTPYNASGAILDTYKGTRIATRTQVAGAQAADAIGPEANVLRPRQAPLQPHADVTQREKYMYFGGAAPDNQGYSPYNTPDANTPAEGRTGGPVTHRNYENTLITNVFGTQGTSDRSQWRYHQPVYCKTYTETLRSQSPGLMSTPLRYIYRGNSTQYNQSYDLGTGFAPLNYDEFGGGCDIPPPCPTTTGDPLNPQPGDVLTGSSYCTYVSITWYNTGSDTPIGTGETYTIQESDYFYKIYYVVTYPNGSTLSSSADCLGTVNAPGYGTYWINRLGDSWQTASYYYLNPGITIDKYGNSYLAWQQGVTPGQSGSSGDIEAYLYVRKLNNKGEELWTKRYASVPILYPTQRVIPTLDTNSQYLYLAWGARFRETDPGQPFSLQPSCELFKINPSNGDVIWYHYYIFAGPGSTYYIDSFTRLQYDSYLNKLVIFYRNYWLAQSFYVDPETPSSITPGSQFYEGSTSESLRTIEDAMVIRSEEDPTKTFVITVDKGNRYIWWETDEYFRSTTGASGLRYGFGTTFTYNNPPRAVPTPVTFSGQEHYISANGELGTARLVVWNQNREPVLRTSTDLGVAVGIAKDTEDPSSVYICFTTGTTTGTPSISGITYKGKSTMSIAKYTPQTNEIKTYSMLTVVSGHLLDINGASNRATMFDGHEGINNNINNVNRAVFTFYNDNTDAVAIASGVNSLFVIGASIMASGTTKYFDWGNTAGYSGVVEATDQISQNLGSTSLPSLATPFSNIGSQYNSPYENGSETVTVVDLTGNITTAYGYTSLD